MAKDTETSTPVIIGIASSAGGLEAITSLVTQLPPQSGAAYVIAQHMSPSHKSLLAILIDRETRLEVVEIAEEPEPITVDTIYVTPPDADVILRDGALHLVEPSGHVAVPKPSADRLFESIAKECGERCAGVVLSGTGSDASYGVQAIRAAGGITIAQDPDSAKYDGMPASAIRTGCVDIVLAPEKIGREVQRILANPKNFEPEKENLPENHISQLLKLVKTRTRHDFGEYKEATIQRRIQRRMQALNVETLDEYLTLCQSTPDEVHALQRDLLISVTKFFRDPQHFGQLENEIRRLVSQEPARIRIWSVGCATGEEAYSIAILVAEALGGLKALDSNRVQIFATDIDEEALHVARNGVYPLSATKDVPQHLVDPYFEVADSTVRVVPDLRAVTMFSKHNIIQDPPFLNIDVVSLRNVLIYFKQSLQERVLSRVHYALKKRGRLFLGSSESLGKMDAMFEQSVHADKIFMSRKTSKIVPHGNPRDNGGQMDAPPKPRKSDLEHSLASPNDEQMFDSLARVVAPNGFLVTRNNDIVRVFGDVSQLLELTEQTILRLSIRILRQGLRDEAPSLIALALKHKSQRTGRWHAIEGHDFNEVRLHCFPIITSADLDKVLMAVETRKAIETQVPEESLSDKERTQYILQIETEMQSTREALQQTVEELQTSNEALQSVNEELQSTNEELQATNEELETSNEELHATNEELITVNEEMQVNASELELVTTEMEAVLTASPFPMLVLDQSLTIRRASGPGLEFLGLPEIPRSGIDLAHSIVANILPGVVEVAQEALASIDTRHVKIDADLIDNKVVIAPFSDLNDNLLGLTITIRVNDFQSTELIQGILGQMSALGGWVYNVEKARFSVLPQEFGGRELSLGDLDSMLEPSGRAQVHAVIADAAKHARRFALQARCLRDGALRLIDVSGTPVLDDTGAITNFIGTCKDVTDLHSADSLLGQIPDLGLVTFNLENEMVILNEKMGGLLKLTGRAHSRERVWNCLQKASQKALTGALERVLETGEPVEILLKLARTRSKANTFTLRLSGNRDHGSVVYGRLET